MKYGRTRLIDPQLRRLRALKMIEARINGATRGELEAQFKISKATVDRELTWAQKAGLVANAEDKILKDLVPLAHEAIKEALVNGNADIALKIFEGTIPGFKKGSVKTNSSGGPIDELSDYLNKLRSASGDIDGIKVLPEATEPAKEAEIINLLPDDSDKDK